MFVHCIPNGWDSFLTLFLTLSKNMKYTHEELERKNFAELKQIGDELNVFPEGDRRLRRNWIRAIEEAAKKSLDVEVEQAQESIELALDEELPSEEEARSIVSQYFISTSLRKIRSAPPPARIFCPGERVRIIKVAAGSRHTELCGSIGTVAQHNFYVSVWVELNGDRKIVFCRPQDLELIELVARESAAKQEPIAQAAKTSPGVDPVEIEPECVECFDDGFVENESGFIKLCQCRSHQKAQSAIAPAAKISLNPKSDLNPILTNADAWDPADFGEVLHATEPNGQLNLLEWDVSEPPEPDDYEGDMFAFQAAYDRWLLTSELHEIIHTKNSPGITQAPEPIAQNATTRLEIPRNESADVCYGRSHPAQPDGNYSSTETAGVGSQEGNRILEVAGNSQAHQGRVIPHQPTQLRLPSRGDDLELEIGMLVGRWRDRQHLGKILDIYKSRRGIWRAKIKPLNKSNFVYFDCAALIEQRLFYDYEIKPGGFLPSGSTFDKTRGEIFEVYSRKVESPKPTNWTAGELSSLSTFKLKQIARDMEPSIPRTAGKRSLIRAILAEQAISQEKAAAQRERETGRAIVQKQKFGPTTGKKKRASTSPLGVQLSLFNVAV